MHFPKKKALVPLFPFIIVVGSGFALGIALLLRSTPGDDLCPAAYGRSGCFVQEAHRLAAMQGVEAAIQFVEAAHDIPDFIINHLALHGIGHEAYRLTKDITKAFSYLPAGATEEDLFFRFNGFKHGVFQAFFEERKAVETPLETTLETCKSFLDIQDLEGLSRTELLRAVDCFHAAGHAIMYVNSNDVFASTEICGELPREWMRQWCYYAVFMEHTYLYNPYYEPVSPRPLVESTPMLTLCRSASEDQRGACAANLSKAFLYRDPGNFEGAFRECGRMGETRERHSCIIYLAISRIPPFFGNDFRQMAAACNYASPEDRGLCLNSIALGVRRGTGGIEGKSYPFCGILESDFREQCEEIVLEGHIPGYLTFGN